MNQIIYYHIATSSVSWWGQRRSVLNPRCNWLPSFSHQSPDVTDFHSSAISHFPLSFQTLIICSCSILIGIIDDMPYHVTMRWYKQEIYNMSRNSRVNNRIIFFQKKNLIWHKKNPDTVSPVHAGSSSLIAFDNTLALLWPVIIHLCDVI